MKSVSIDLVAAQLAFCASTALPNDFPSWLSVRPSVRLFQLLVTAGYHRGQLVTINGY
jgi:hypothetical protein